MKKRILAIGLCLCLSTGMFSTLGTQTFAEEAAQTQGQAPESYNESSTQDSAGNNVELAGNEANQADSPENAGNNSDTAQSPEENADVPDNTVNNSESADDGISSAESEVKGNEAEIESGTEDNTQQNKSAEENGAVTPVEIQCMDEDGNIYYIMDDVSPVVKSVEYRTRAANNYVVNFRAKKDNKDAAGTMNYTEYGTGEAGYLNRTSGADAAYLGTEKGKVKFMISGVIGMVDESEVQLVTLQSTKSISSYYADGTNIVHRICTNLNVDYTSTIKVGQQPSYMAGNTTYYSYDGHYFYKDYSVMLSDYRNNTRKQSINPNDPYYNYYQFLPLRSTTSYSASQLTAKINARISSDSKMWNLGTSLVNNQNTYGVNALLMAGLAANESGWGKSEIAKKKNNLFGLGAVDSSPGESADTFTSIDSCVRNFAEGWMSKRYLNPNNSNYYGGFLGNKASGINVKYASDPYWGEKAANIAMGLDSDKTDVFKYTIGIKDADGIGHTDLNIRTDSSASSNSIFTTGSQSGHAFIILGEANGFYKVQSDPVLNSGRTKIDSSGKYNFSLMYAYAGKDYVTVVSGEVNQGGSGGTDNGGTDNGGTDNGGTADSPGDTLAVRRGNTYYFKYSLSNGAADLTVKYGKAGDDVLIGDWDGDGVDTLCVRRGNVYYFKNSLANGEADSVVHYGRKNDEVLVGDWNGDGKDTLCVRRGNSYFIKNSIADGAADVTIPYGRKNDIVLVGDWDGDGTDTLCVRRGNTYYFKNSLMSGEADAVIPYGKAADIVMVGDWDGNGTDTLCVRRGNAYYIKNSITSGQADSIVLYGRKDDITYAGNWK